MNLKMKVKTNIEEEMLEYAHQDAEHTKKLYALFDELKNEMSKDAKILDLLNIPYRMEDMSLQVNGAILVKIFMDEEKCQKLISMLKNKTMW